MDKKSYSDKKRTQKRYKPVILTFFIGVIISLILYFVVLNWEDERIKSEFDRRADDFVTILQSGIARTKGVLRSIAAFNAVRRDAAKLGYNAYVKEFKEFSTCSLSCHSETLMLGWAPRIRASERELYETLAQESGYDDFLVTEYSKDGQLIKATERDEYFPIYNVEPYEEHKDLLGYDLASNEDYFSAINKARDTDKAVSTKWEFRVGNNNEFTGTFGYLLFMPLYKDNMHYSSVKARQVNLTGFAVGHFVVDDLIEYSFKKFDMKGIDVHIYDRESHSLNKRLIYRSREGRKMQHPKDEDVEAITLMREKSLTVGGREWGIVFHITEEYMTQQMRWQSKIILVFGLLLTSVLVTYLFLSAGETTYIERLVEERTAELFSVNTSLENEVEKHKLTGAALKESEENYRNIYNNAQVGLFRVKVNNGEVINANMKFVHMFGYDTQQEVIAELSLFECFVNPDEYNRMLVVLQQNGEVQNFEVELKKRDGTIIFIRIWARIYLEKCFIEGVATDITEEKEVEDHNKRLQSQLLQSQKIESIGRLAGGIAHDFNNMLTGILGYAELSLNEIPKDHPVYRKLQVIESSSQKAAALTRQLLAFSRKQILDMKVVNPNTVVENMSKLLERVIGDDIQLRMKTKRSVSNIMADPTQVEQILMNLVVNARDAMAGGGYLTVETKDVELKEDDIDDFKTTPGQYVLISVSDTGIGMGTEVMEKIFEPFFTTKQKGKGTGLGLSTVFGIVKQHKGHIVIDSEVGEGTTFKVYLPVSKTEEGIALVEKEPADEMQRGSETILVVDDEEFVCNLLQDTLEPLGYKIIKAYNSDDALKRCYTSEECIDLLLTDIVMPGVNGRELSEAALVKCPDMKVIFMSGYTDDVIVHHGVLKSGVEFIQKPLTPRKVAKKIREVLDRDKMTAKESDEA